MLKIKLLFLLLFIHKPSVLAGTAFCSFEHTNRYQSDLITEEITGYICNLDLDVKGERVNDIGGYHEGGERDSQVDIIRVLPNFYTYLTSYPDTICKKFPKLEIIDMGKSEIAIIEANSLNLCKDLRILQFYMNKLERIPENLLDENKKLLQLYIIYNSITTLPENLLNGLKELKLLDLSYNQIDSLSDNIFKNLPSLKELNLEANKLEALESVIFEDLGNLEKLNLNNNGISELEGALFASLVNLKTLSLKDNKLTIIHADSFPQQVNIDTVELSRNQIIAIDEYFIDTCGIFVLKMGSNVCDKTGTIKKKDMKKKLKKCFDKYKEIQNGPTTTAASTSTTSRKTSTTTTIPPTTTSSTIPTTVSSTTTQTTTSSPTIPPLKKIQALNEPCGVAKAGVPNVVNGLVIVHGTHPWIAAIMYENNYLCGGTLVTKKKVVSAAHCFKGKDITVKQESKTVVLLGAQKLNNSNEVGRVTVGVEAIKVHPNWDPEGERYDADIAVLILDEEVTFGHYIQPACLSFLTKDLKDMNDGVIVGFGKSESSASHENEPRKASTPIQKSEDCFSKFPNLVNVASHRTICGGNANGTGACTGDSGGGLTVVNNGRHFLRGIVSASLYSVKYGCNVDSYSIFTDMRFFISFVKDPK